MRGVIDPHFHLSGRSDFGLPRPKISETERVLQKSVTVHTAMAADHGAMGLAAHLPVGKESLYSVPSAQGATVGATVAATCHCSGLLVPVTHGPWTLGRKSGRSLL